MLARLPPYLLKLACIYTSSPTEKSVTSLRVIVLRLVAPTYSVATALAILLQNFPFMWYFSVPVWYTFAPTKEGELSTALPKVMVLLFMAVTRSTFLLLPVPNTNR